MFNHPISIHPAQIERQMVYEVIIRVMKRCIMRIRYQPVVTNPDMMQWADFPLTLLEILSAILN